ncbi:adenylate/guanylate cyclase domain-containing protein [Leptolyngbyaceae cyanobacterium CCMR0082]|uniref:Adenylate/guanylate cyclase domain-containing protein n=2 Tax=Adonisia turfae TaxID=2950184 RepID=A0A6M0S1D5_9CYAN|nr:adenylate/guanylate cyclase domain-containing protein [Adonisia turfae]MDV3353367.1 adenylate/guanylate cyclase domain-containing protein [Leptothoe sp. LEGE 181152]NEZ60646.1 adenylate/guanylate cyclase domain-containing protein [Adonisia turfae CCMR0081]NEZ62289.1 adenylate/guanylate cyclase domain-containing protein [Adonisia turfae CCMR0082]
MEGAQPSLQTQQRVLAAIVVTDAVGFSAQMSSDEERALAIINRDLKQIAGLCNVFKGQVLKSTGDGLLMCFFSAAQAVACALNIQKKLRGDSKRDSFDHRIGIHLGDVYINNSDVMGNGVNIAARLESFAAPGEICVSQVVYDVVKSRLDLDATFLGPLNLKNIQESVPAYQLRPVIELEVSDAEMTRPFFAEGFEGYAFESPIDQALQSLGDHPDHLRIKKLIFGTCQNLWENDTTVLDQFSLQHLIDALVQRNPSVEHCRASLYRIVATLNHKEVYSDVAEVILQAITPLYIERAASLLPGGEPEEAEDAAEESVEESKDRYQQVADELERDSQIIRIKKVLYCLCHKVWETDIRKIEQADTAILIQQLYQLTPTPNDLKYRLRHLLHHLNRKTKYTKIVNIIFKAFHPLYSAQTELIPMSTPGFSTANDTDSPETCFGDLPVGIHPENTVAYSAKSLEGPSMEVAQVKDRADLFELRLDIIKYCNPLRAKILLHSTLYSPFTGSSQEWSLLRSKTLEDFLREVFNYCSSFQDLESKLSIIVHCLEDTDDNEPVVTAILNAIKPYYAEPDEVVIPVDSARAAVSAVTSMRPASYG